MATILGRNARRSKPNNELLETKNITCSICFLILQERACMLVTTEGYTATDIMCRYKRMKGFNVLHPMGWDAFGLPAEQYAIQTGTHPAVTTNKNCDNFRRQIKSLGLSYDWDREINTTDPKYFRWTQWIFTKLYNCWFDP